MQRLKPPGTKFCCGVSYPHPQCDDCPMRAWDLENPDHAEAKRTALGLVQTHSVDTASGPARRLLNLAICFLQNLRKRNAPSNPSDR